MQQVCISVESGGNQVFFANGILAILADAAIPVAMCLGCSSSQPVILAYLLHTNREILEEFSQKLDENKKNFYLFRSPHFPHNEIYKSSVALLVETYTSQKQVGNFMFAGAVTRRRGGRTKAILASILLALKYVLRIDLIDTYRKWAGVHDITISSSDTYTPAELIDFIMGSSTIYPFIELHAFRGQLVLEGALVLETLSGLLRRYDKRIFIHTERGVTGASGNTFHIYASKGIPLNILNYTSGSEIRALHALGESDMRQHLPALLAFLQG